MKALELKDLKKTYAGNIEALKGITLSVEQGDFFALLGPNGAGKSTTIGIITSLVLKTSGIVKVFGQPLNHHASYIKSLIGLVPQEFNFNIFHTPLQILISQAGYYGINRSLAHKQAEKYLKKLHIWDKRNQKTLTLSGGQKRRLMIARALIHEPPLLILDEPTAGVDIEIRRDMWQFFREINQQGTTIILTTHYLEEAETLCKNIAIINHGNIIEHNSMQEILKKLYVETFILYSEEAFHQAPNIPDFNLRLIDPFSLELDIRKGQIINTFFAELTKQNIRINSMRNKVNRLEELFVRMTMDISDES